MSYCFYKFNIFHKIFIIQGLFINKDIQYLARPRITIFTSLKNFKKEQQKIQNNCLTFRPKKIKTTEVSMKFLFAFLCLIKLLHSLQLNPLNLAQPNEQVIEYLRLQNTNIFLNRVVLTLSNGSKQTWIKRSNIEYQNNNLTVTTDWTMIQIIASEQSSHLILSAYQRNNANCFIIANKQTQQYQIYNLNIYTNRYSNQKMNFYSGNTPMLIDTDAQNTKFNFIGKCDIIRVNNMIFLNYWQQQKLLLQKRFQDIHYMQMNYGDFIILEDNYLYRTPYHSISFQFLRYNFSKEFEIQDISQYDHIRSFVHFNKSSFDTIIIAAWKYSQLDQIYLYKVVISKWKSHAKILQIFDGISKKQPLFNVDQLCTKIFIATVSYSNKSFYILKSIDVAKQQKQIFDIPLPIQLQEKQFSFYLTQNYLYLKDSKQRNINQSIQNFGQFSNISDIKECIYEIKDKYLHPIEQSTLKIKQGFILLDYSAFEQKQHLIRNYWYYYNQQFYFKSEKTANLDDLRSIQEIKGLEMAVNTQQIVKNPISTVFYPKDLNQWIFTSLDITSKNFQIYLIIYDQKLSKVQQIDNSLNVLISKFQTNYSLTPTNNYTFNQIVSYPILNYSSHLNCIVLKYNNFFKLIQYDQLNNFSETILNQENMYRFNSYNLSFVTVSEQCESIILYNNNIENTFKLFQKSKDSSKYQQKFNFSSIDYAFDMQLQFIVDVSTLYQLIQGQYRVIYELKIQLEQKYLSPGLIKVNEQKDKILISITTQNLDQNYADNNLENIIVFLFQEDGIWKEFVIQQFDIYRSAIIDASPDLSIFQKKSCKQNQTFEGSALACLISLFYIDFTPSSVEQSEKDINIKISPIKFFQYQYKINDNLGQNVAKLTNNFLYTINATHEIIYKIIRSQSLRTIQLKPWKINQYDFGYSLLNQNQVVIQKNQNLQIIYQYHNFKNLQSQYIQYQKKWRSYFTNSNGQIKLIKRKINLKLEEEIPNTEPDQRGYVYDQKQNILQCPPACQVCFSPNSCRKCIDGHSLDIKEHICFRCSESCKSCQSSKANICHSCYPTYYLQQTSCQKCHRNCLQCSSQGKYKCTDCRRGYSLLFSNQKEQKTCVPCPENCQTCSNSQIHYQQIKCQLCISEYGVNSNGICQRCLLNCYQCDGDNITICKKCSNGFYISEVVGNNIICKRCQKNCKKCQIQFECLQCHRGFQLNINKTACKVICHFPCRECDQFNRSMCTSCYYGYLLDSAAQLCLYDWSCLQTQSCKSCPQKYTLFKGKCQPCLQNQKCTSCNKYNFSSCLSCEKNQYLESGQCIDCPLYCEQCLNSLICIKCASNYIFAGSNSPSVCIKCSSNCLTCQFSPSNCLSCFNSFVLQGFSCVPALKITFSFTIDYDYQMIDSKKLISIKKQLADQLKKNINQIYYTQVRSGSVIIQGIISSQTLQDEVQIMKNLNDISADSFIDDTKITQSSFTASLIDNSLLQTEHNSSIGLILGIVIPICLLLILILVGVVYIKHKKYQQAKAQYLKEQEQVDWQNNSQQQRVKRRLQRMNKKLAKFLPSVSNKNSNSSLQIPNI